MGRQAEKTQTGSDHFEQEEGIEVETDRFSNAAEIGNRVVGVADAPCMAGPVGTTAASKAGNRASILHPANGQNFEREDRAGNGCSKHRTEACGNAGH